MTISFYSKGEERYRYLSNFAASPIQYNNQQWKTAEHLYQAMKYRRQSDWTAICALESPVEAKKYESWSHHQEGKRENWHEIKVEAMRKVLHLKFRQNPELAQQLVATGSEELVHYAPWDGYWGTGKDGRGQNVMGKLLEELRAQLQQ